MASQNKPVYFNIDTEKDYLAFAESVGNFSAWVKARIDEAMPKRKESDVSENKIVWNVPKGRG